LLGNGGTTAGTNFIGTTDAIDFVAKTNNTERMRILSTGNVGIGTSSPSELLHIYGGSAVNAGLKISSNLGNTNTIFKVIDTKGLQIQNGSATSIMAFDNTNLRVGINTTNPQTALDVKGTLRLSGSTSGYVGFQPAAAAGSTTYTLPTADGTAGQQLTTDGSGNLSWSGSWSLTGNSGTTAGTNFIGTTDAIDFVAKTNNTERMRILSTGTVGIGTSTPNSSTKLDVNGGFKLGSSGTALSNMIKTNGSLSSAVTVPVSGVSSSSGTITISGAALNNTVILNPRSALPAGVAIAYAYVSAANTITINFIGSLGLSVAATVPTSTVFDITIIQ
jgi:hypothetical protein